MGYFVYGRMDKPWTDRDGKFHDADKKFRPLDGRGVQVGRLAQACEYASKQDAEEFIASHTFRDGCKLEIRHKK